MTEDVAEKGVDEAAEKVVVHRAGEGPGTWAMGSLFEHLVSASDTGGSFGMSLVTQPPGIATPLHRHTKEAEAVFVLSGLIEYRAGDETFELREGSFLYLPLGLPHAFRIRGDEPARFLGFTTPGGLMGLYDEVGVPASGMHIPSEGEGLSMDEEIAHWNDVGPRYGLQVVGPPIPE